MPATVSPALALLLAAVAHAQPAASDVPADTIYSGGPILTMNDAAMRAQAVAVKGGKIIAVGAEADVMKLRAPSTAMVDLAGKAMIPGFVDAHGHVIMGGLQALSANLLAAPDGNVRDIASLQQTLRDWVAANAQAVRDVNLIMGFGYDQAQLKELRPPNRSDLDAVSKDVPILTVHQSGHIIAVNSKALEIAGITADTPDPAGGRIQREADGKTPSGVLEETAAFPVLAKLLAQIGKERAPRIAIEGTKLWARFGYTTAQEGRASALVTELARKIGASGDLKIDVAIYPDVLLGRDFIQQNISREYTNRVRVAGAKLTIDGSVQGFTAWRDRPYYKPVGDYAPGYVGYAAATPEQVRDAIEWCYANNIQLLTHSNGEAASDQLIAFTNAAVEKHGVRPLRNTLIHGQVLREDQVDALKRLQIIPSLFPMHTFYWGDWHRDHTVGPVVAENISPTGWCVQRGMIFTSHHDAPVAFPDSMRVLDATVTRRTRSGDILGPAQRVDVITGLKAMTIWPAYQHFEESTKGSIEVGKVADLVILSADPTAIDPETIDTIKVVQTIKEGTPIFTLTPEEARKSALMLRPTPGGEDVFERYLIAAARDQDLAAMPEFARRRALAERAANPMTGPHDKACVLRAVDQLSAALATSNPTAAR
jgi:predicted amidohydrolase YtcJ